MAADVITRFRLETTQYDSALRDSSKALAAYAKQTESAGKDFTNFSQNAINAAKSLGQVASGATNTKDKLRDLVGAYNDVAKTYNKLSEVQRQTDFGKNMAASLEQLQVRIKETKQELYGLGDAVKGGGGGLFGGGKLDGMLQVFGGNLMTKAAGWATGFASEIGDAVKQGIELAKQGEGIRIAFERLGRGDILQGLREATHGTVTDLELMKAAVKFNDFKLPLDQLGTMLAFAQQKAKDTGQSVDYMVESITNGLGRQSKPILDNLGISAKEIEERMKSTGDFTKAVGEIIREQMAKAGDYVETAADRAAQANVSLQNKMEELGRKFAPLEEASNNFWTSMKIGILDVIGGPLTNLLNKLTEAGRLMNAYGQMGGSGKVGRMTQNLSNASEGNRQSIYQQQQAKIWDYINRRENYMKDRQRWVNGGGHNEDLRQSLIAQAKSFGTSNVNDIKAQIDAAKKMLADYQQAAKTILNPIKAENLASLNKTPKTPKSGKTGKTETVYVEGSIAAQAKLVSDLTKKWNEAGEDMRTGYLFQLVEAEKKLKTMKDEQQALKDMKTMKNTLPEGLADQLFPRKSLNELLNVKFGRKQSGHKDDKNNDKTVVGEMQKLTGGVQGIFSGIEQMGVEIPEELKGIMSGISGVMTILTSINTILGVIEGLQAVGVLPFFARGGIVPHAAGGYMVPGTHYSGDVTPILANAGEVVLNRAQTAGLAQELEGVGSRQVNVHGVLRGKDIFIAAENWSRSAGRGEFVTW